MEIRTIKHAAKMSEWGEHIRLCRSSGKPVSVWCKENNINVKSYYRWERLYIAQAAVQMDEAPALLPGLVRIEPERLPEAVPARSEANMHHRSSGRVIILRYGCAELELPPDTPVCRITELLRALKEI